MKLSVLIPVYNEAASIADLVERVAAVDIDKEIIVVDDGSEDTTPEIVSELAVDGLRLIRHPENRGKGAAIRTGLAYAAGDAVIIQDADLEHDPDDYLPMLEALAREDVDAVLRCARSQMSAVLHALGRSFYDPRNQFTL